MDCDGPVIAITPLTDRIIRVRLAPEGAFEPRRSWAVARSDEEFPGATVELSATEQTLFLQTAALTLRIALDSGKLSFFDAGQQPFCADEVGLQWHSDGAGARRVACSKRIEAGEHFYGFGERTGQLDK
ncbi:MAG: DUF4968 domain-containing protein, partial [Chloroflexi bacterium]|nr:DUF4968 domain-containing protein [Chloroflexota bacterium]